jgi:hypothetical protein
MALPQSLAPKRLYPLIPNPEGVRLSTENKRFKVVPAGRRSGKTERAKRKIITSALTANDTLWDDPRFFVGAPTRDQANAIYWKDIKAMFPPVFIRSISESHLRVTLENGAEAHVIGMDRPERIEGSPWDGGVLDEYANMKKRTWGEHVRPALSDRKGWCWLIGVPEGRNHYYDLYKYAVSGVDKDWAAYTWPSSEVLDPDEVAAARRQLDELVFKQEYEASFVNFEGRCYYPFQEDTHTAPLFHLYNRAAPLNVCFDFNVEPGVAAVCQELSLPGQFERGAGGAVLIDRPIVGTAWIGEVWIPRNSNTPAVVQRFITDWGKHQGEVRCYGDATGGARGTAKVDGSDWDLIKKDMRAHFGDRVSFHVPRANPAERSRVNAVNTRLQNGVKEIRMMVDPERCPHLVSDFEGVRTLEGGSGEIDKKADPKLTHISDAAGYYVEKEFPIMDREGHIESLRA